MSDKTLEEKVKIIAAAQGNFFYFTENIFSKSFSNFTSGKYIEESCNYISKYDRTMKVAARSHFKSTIFYDKIMRDIMFEGINRDLDIRYFSYNESLAGWHVGQIKSYIDKNPFFSELINLKPLAENVAAYTWNKKYVIRIRPVGIISFTRGAKSDYIYLDDMYADPATAIHPTIIFKINQIFKSVILEAIRPGGEIHITGSTLSRADIYFDKDIAEAFHVIIRPGIIKDESGNEAPRWPEFYTLKQIKDKVKVMGERAFSAEIMCEPFYSTDSFFKKEQLRKDIVNPQLKNIRLLEGRDTPELVIAGLDIGKKKHPSVLHVYEIKNGKAIQIHRKVMKGWPYYTAKPYDPLHPSQVEYCKEAIKNFGISFIYYDNTRGEFEGAMDSGLLTTHFIPIVVTAKLKIQLALDLEKIVLNKQIEIFDDEEMLNSICAVTNDLQKIEDSSGGHCDDFDSLCYAMSGFTQWGQLSTDAKKISVGGKSIFENESPPLGW